MQPILIEKDLACKAPIYYVTGENYVYTLQSMLTCLYVGFYGTSAMGQVSEDNLCYDVFNHLKTLNKGYVITTDAVDGITKDYLLIYCTEISNIVYEDNQYKTRLVQIVPATMFNDILAYLKTLDVWEDDSYQFVYNQTFIDDTTNILQSDDTAVWVNSHKIENITYPPEKVANFLNVAHYEQTFLPIEVCQQMTDYSYYWLYGFKGYDYANFTAIESGEEEQSDIFEDMSEPFINAYNLYFNSLEEIPPVPVETAIIGMVNAYNPTPGQLLEFARWVWSTDVWTDTQDFKSPLNAILGVRLIYVTPELKELSENIKVGTFDSKVACSVCSNMFVTVDCGETTVIEKYNNVHDYTGVETVLYLPFIGYQSIDTALIMDKVVSLKYRVNVLNGDCVAYVSVYDETISSQLEIATYSGNMGTSIPLNGSVSNMSDIDLNNPLAMLSHVPYIDIIRPVPYEPQNKNYYEGLPCNDTVLLEELTGYTKCKAVFIEGLTATNTEIETIKNLLESGVIL